MKKFWVGILAVACFVSHASADIHVSGTGSVVVTPDTALISLAVATRADASASAVEANAALSTRAFAAAKEFKIADSDICTHGFNVSKLYEKNSKGEYTDRVIGYVAINQLVITVKDTTKSGAVLAELAKLGDSVQIADFQFVVSDALRNSVTAEARKLAVQDAKSRATLYAENAGASVGQVKEIREGAIYVPRYDKSNNTLMRETSVPTSAGTSNVSVTVQLVFTLK